MMDSSTGGPLLPQGPQPAYGAALDASFQSLIAGITDLPGALVRPSWQAVVPKQPEAAADWCGFAVTVTTADEAPALLHQHNGRGADLLVRHEDLELVASFYGPGGQGYAARLRDGLTVPQNLEPLDLLEMGFVECSPLRALPELVNQTWIRRTDLVARFRRKVARTYLVLDIDSAEIDVVTDTNTQDTIVVSAD